MSVGAASSVALSFYSSVKSMNLAFFSFYECLDIVKSSSS
jgi:hypothetical protein